MLLVPWSEIVACLRQVGFDGWISVHREYGDQAVQAVIEDISKDLGYLRGVIASS